jgi:hypothetical protein
MKVLELTRGDTAEITYKLDKKQVDGTWAVPDFSGASVRLIIREIDGRWVWAGAGTWADIVEGIAAAYQEADTLGSPGDGPTAATAEWEVTYSSGRVETFPKQVAKIPVIITDDLD